MIIGERDRRQIVERFKSLENPVRIVYFTQEFECDYCRETGELLRELAGISDKIRLDVFNFQLDREQVQAFAIDKIPAAVIMGEKDYGIRFYGVPLGYEFANLLEAILDVSKRDSGLAAETKSRLRELRDPLHIQVLVTPT
jgi:glutaredoxin-like protein